MAQIVIREVDDTTPQGVAQSTDIVYIPGYADTNFNCYICGEQGVAPDTSTKGRVGGSSIPSREDYNIHGTSGYPQYFVNTFEKKVWYCSAISEGSPDTYTWTLCDSYVEPSPENTPVLCNSVVEFEKNFGKLPLDIELGSGVEYDKSYIMARELISAGLPVLYENVVYRSDSYVRRIGIEPTNGFDKAFANISDIGEYSVKYITSGGYPLYGLKTTSHIITQQDVGHMYFSISSFVERDIHSLSIGSKLYTIEYGSTGPSSADCVLVEERSSALRFTFYSEGTDADPAFVEGAEVVINNLVGAQCKAAYDRGDAVALVDHTDVPGRPLVGSGSVFDSIDDASSIFKTSVTESAFGCKEYGAYCAMFTPYASYQCVAQDGNLPVESRKQILPASFAYLVSLAKSIKTNANWLAVSGVSRGLVPNIISLNTTQKLTNKIADTYQPKTDVAINAITNIQPYGLTIWGNRTLFANTANGLQAHSFLNTRNMVNEIKKVAYSVAKSLMFEQNSESLWLAFKSGLLPILNQMQSGQGLTAYKIIRQETSEKYKMSAVIKLYPIYAVEEIEVNIYLENEEITVQ